MGFDANEMASVVTYIELVQSGQLNLIRDAEIRRMIISFYRSIDRLTVGLGELPPVNNAFASLTGYYPHEIANRFATLTPVAKERIIVELRENQELMHQIRTLHAQVFFNDRLFEDLISQAEELLVLMN